MLDQMVTEASGRAAKMNQEAKEIYQSQVREAAFELMLGFLLLLGAAFLFTRSITRTPKSLIFCSQRAQTPT